MEISSRGVLRATSKRDIRAERVVKVLMIYDLCSRFNIYLVFLI